MLQMYQRLCAKTYQNRMRFDNDKVITKTKDAFLSHSVVLLTY